MRLLKATGFVLLLAVVLCLPAVASARSKKDACAKADLKLALTGEGDSDGDGLSDCRESRYVHSLVNDPDSDDDGLSDGEEMHASCNPMDPDSDHDGIEDGDDASPVVVQKMEAILDALVCPQPAVPPSPGVPGSAAVPGSITALGTTAVLDETTRFDDTTCAELATRLAAGPPPIVEIKILENVLGVLTAKKVELVDCERGGGDRGDDHHGDDD